MYSTSHEREGRKTRREGERDWGVSTPGVQLCCVLLNGIYIHVYSTLPSPPERERGRDGGKEGKIIIFFAYTVPSVVTPLKGLRQLVLHVHVQIFVTRPFRVEWS